MTTETVTLTMAEIRPHLDEVLKYVLAASRQLHLPPSIHHRADLSTEENRRAVVEYALSFAGECAREKAENLGWDPDDWPDDEEPPLEDLAPIRRGGRGPRGRPRTVELDIGGPPENDSAAGFANVPRGDE